MTSFCAKENKENVTDVRIKYRWNCFRGAKEESESVDWWSDAPVAKHFTERERESGGKIAA